VVITTKVSQRVGKDITDRLEEELGSKYILRNVVKQPATKEQSKFQERG